MLTSRVGCSLRNQRPLFTLGESPRRLSQAQEGAYDSTAPAPTPLTHTQTCHPVCRAEDSSHTWGKSWPVISHARYLRHLEWMGPNAPRASDGTSGLVWQVPSDLTYYLCFLEKYTARISIVSQCSLKLRDELLTELRP